MTDIDQGTRRPMMLAARELLSRELDTFKDDAFGDDLYVSRDQTEYMRALMDLLDSLNDAEEPVVLMPTPGFHVRREDGGHVVYGWYFVLLASHGGKIRRQEYVSFHHFRWTARRAGNAWLKRAQFVSERIARELSSQMKVEN